MITLELTRPLESDLQLNQIDKHSFQELHYGKLPLIWLRPKLDEQIGLAEGETGCFRFNIAPINLPAGLRRCSNDDWEDETITCSGSSRDLVTGNESFVFFLIYDVQRLESCEDSNYEPLSLDFCPPEAADEEEQEQEQEQEQDQEQSDDDVSTQSYGTDSPCVKALTSTSIEGSPENWVTSPLVCIYDHNRTVQKQMLKEKLWKKYFKRIGKKPPSDEEKSKSPIKMIAALIPGKGIVWIPMRGNVPNDFDEDFKKGKKGLTAYSPVFLDGPNIWIARLKDKDWDKPD